MRNNKQLIWMSSYDRGLEWLLNMWPEIKKQVPDVTLRIFYGWNLFDFVHANNPERQAWKKKINEMMNQDGITHVGRVGHKELEKAIKESGIWAYPTDFGEISCISAMKAQCWGAIPVVSDYAALKETVQYGIKIPLDEPYKARTKEWQAKYVENLVQLLNNPSKQEELRKPMRSWAKKTFAWSTVAKSWTDEFK